SEKTVDNYLDLIYGDEAEVDEMKVMNLMVIFLLVALTKDTDQVEYLPPVTTDSLFYDNEENLADRNCNDEDNKFFHELEASSVQANAEEDNNEITHYVKLKEIKINDDLLEWLLTNR
ncbi:28471_t:CDS:2, partial [Gigaspora margarita]